MAKKPNKAAQVAADAEPASESLHGINIEAALAAVAKSYGKGIVSSGQSIIDTPKVVIPISPSLDSVVGGIPEGSWCSFSGPEKVGKTTTALAIAANAQRKEYGFRPIFYYAVEHRLKKRDLEGIKGLNVSDSMFHVIKSEKGRLLSSVDFLNICGQFISAVPNSVHIIDSVSALCNPTVLESGMGTQDRGAGNKYISQFCDINQATVPIQNAIVIGIVHLYSNTGGGAAGKIEKAAARWKYQADVWLQAKWAEAWRVGGTKEEDGTQIGQIVHWSVKTTAMKGFPGGKCESYLRYGIGLDNTYELLVFAKDIGLISASGSWLTFDFLTGNEELLDGKDKITVQGMEKAYAALENNPAWTAVLQQTMNKILAGG